MYIPQFVCGFIVGAVVASITITIWAMRCVKEQEEEEDDE